MSDWQDTGLPCPCGSSSDAYAINAQGWGKCFSCDRNFPPNNERTEVEQTEKVRALALPVEIAPLMKRGIDENVCRKFGYGYVEYKGRRVQAAPYHDKDGKLVAQKLRYPDKSMVVLGKMPGTLFGQHLFKPGRRLVITEGEIDAMSVYQVVSTRAPWPVVSIPNGASGAEKAIRKNIDFIESFDEVVLCFDNDDPGREAVEKCAPLITPGKCFVARLPMKDANEMLQAGKIKDLYHAVWDAKPWRPDAIVNGNDLWAEVNKQIPTGIPYPWARLNDVTYGQHDRTIVTWTAGSGIGKSAFVREIAYALAMHQDRPIGYIALEESVGRSAKGFVGVHLNKPIHLPGTEVDPAELRKAFDETLGTGKFWLYDHFGSLEDDRLFSQIRWLASQGCHTIVLDHLTIVLSGLDVDDERKAIDQTMTRLRQLVEQTGIQLHLVSHLRRPQGRGHEDGAKPSLAELRGSHGIVQLSDFVIGLQRNQSSADASERNTTTIWVLKNRLSGDTGVGTVVRYSKETGRLTEIDWCIGDDGEVITAPSEEEMGEEVQDDDF